jgi:hypothetical protein
MKRYLTYIEVLTVAFFIGLLAGCSEKNLDSPEGPEADPSVLLNAGEMPFRLGFNLVGEKPAPKSKASIVGGEEDTRDYVKTITMLCFTKEGIYLGYRRGELRGTEHWFTESGHPNCYGRDLFTGTIPANTTRIHFLANAEGHIPGFDKTGTLENVLMRNVLVTSGLEDRRVIYWGFHKEETTAAMKEWLSKMVVTEDPVTGKKDTTYVKRDGSLVHLIRDRARIKFGTMTDDPQANPPSGNDYRILQIDWLLSNGLNRGFIAPYKASSADHYAGYINDNTLVIDEDRHSPYNLSDAARYTADDEDEMVTVYKWENGAPVYYTNDISRMLYLFEDENNANNPPKLILRVKYQKNYPSTSVADQVTKYHTLMLLDKDNQPLKVLRNHSFVVNIHSMPWKGIGHMTFLEAVNTTEYENNRTVTIDDNVDDITDGKYELSIKDGTSKIYRHGTENSSQTIYFEFKPTDAAQGSADWHSLMDTVTKKGFKINWEETPDATFAVNDVKIDAWDNTTGQGTITFTLGSLFNEALQSGVINIQNMQTGLTRRIHIYTISSFSFFPLGSTSITLVRDGTNTRRVSGQDCDTYKLTLRIPGNYPSGLYPIRVRMASTTLNPFKYEVNGGTDETINVETAGTENGNTVDGEVLAGMSYVTTANKWNTREEKNGVIQPWNYWYFFDLLTKPTTTDSGGQTVEDMSDKLYTIYFDDTRPLRAQANRADGIGLFLKIKYFGPFNTTYNVGEAIAITTQ